MDQEQFEDGLMNVMETCGQAFGFALAAAMREAESLRTSAGLESFASALATLVDDERFSGEVALVMAGIAEGIRARARATPDAHEFL